MMIISDTGGGHRASAMAVKGAIEHLHGPRFQIDVVDLWKKHTPWPHCKTADAYGTMVKYPILWRIAFRSTQPKAVHVPQLRAVRAMVASRVAKAFDDYDPDLVVSLHPLLQHVPIQVLEQRAKRGHRKPAFATVVTDLTTCHPTWYHPRVDRLFAPTAVVRDAAIRYGVDPRKIILHGLPIRPAFSVGARSKMHYRRALGLPSTTPLVLVVGGGEGMGPVERQVKALRAETWGPEGVTVAVVCGRNEKLRSRLAAAEAVEVTRHSKAADASVTLSGGGPVVVRPLGFVTDMHAWMFASDVLITKAGPGTIAEALACGLPMLLNAFIPCQEEGNITYVKENDVGGYERDVKKAAKTVRRWITGPESEQRDRSARAKALGHPRATFLIAEDLVALIPAKCV